MAQGFFAVGLAAAGPVAAVIGARATFLDAATLITTSTALVLISRDVRTLERRTSQQAR